MEVYLIYLVQILLVIHVLKTGQERFWILLLIFLPVLGGVAYAAVVLLPEYTGSMAGQRAARGIRQTLNPGGSLRRHEAAWSQSPNADNARRYADALLGAGKPDRALDVLDEAMEGFFSDEPSLKLLRGRARFDQGDVEGAARELEEVWEADPAFKSPEGRLLYARALESAGETERSLEAYREIAHSFPGAEARYRYALALEAAGREADARGELKQLVEDARLAPGHYRKAQGAWIRKARARLKQLG